MAPCSGGTNPALRTFYYRLLRLVALSIHPVFVFDGPNKPPFKRNKRTGGPGVSVASIPEFLAKQLLKQFAFPIHLAPGEAEAECALLQREGIVDAVLSEDVDTLMFGSRMTIRNWSPEQRSSKTPTHVNVYDAVETKNGPSGLDREGMILVALMSGGDYVPEGIPGCGPKKACEAARAGFGSDLCRIARGDKTALREWKDRLQHEIKTNESKFFAQKRPSMKIPDDFPRTDILGYYTHPAISSQAGLDRLRNSIKWDQDIDFAGLRSFAHDAFEWVRLEGAKHFIRSLAPSLLVRSLRMRGEQLDRFPSDDLQAIQEDEALLVNGIHGKRQHAVTDNTTELRVSFTPLELVKIDLSLEDPDDELEIPLASEGDVDEEIPLDIDDDTEGPKKRGPTKFDPCKPVRVWVLETYVKVGAPLKVQDWEAERQRPIKSKRTASADNANSTVPKPRTTRRTKTTNSSSQPAIQNFAKVTKPGVRSSRTKAKTTIVEASETTTKHDDTVVSLFPPIPGSVNIFTSRVSPEASISLLPELPASVTKRRRGPIQRAHTLPSNPPSALERSASPPPDAIETLYLVDPLPALSLSQAPARKSRIRAARSGAVSRTTRAATVTASPVKTKQTTLDTWGLPDKPRDRNPIFNDPKLPQAPRFVTEAEVEILDLTLSSPLGPLLPQEQSNSATQPSSQTIDSISNRRPVVSLAPDILHRSNGLFPKEQKASKSRPKLMPTSRRTSPSSLSKLLAPSETAPLDLTELSSSPPRPNPISPLEQRSDNIAPEVDTLDLTATPPASTNEGLPPVQNGFDTTLMRSPRAHGSPSPAHVMRKISPPAAWKKQATKKREIILRRSLAGAWKYVDAESPGKNDVAGGEGTLRKGKERRRWRESEIEVLDLC